MKRALVLSGGGCKGAYEVGAIEHLCGELGIEYDIICGVSVGALNGSFLAQFPTGEANKASESLSALWDEIQGNKTIYKNWFGWWLAALWRPSVYNSEPLQKLVRSKLNVDAIHKSGKILRVGATSLVTGKYRTFSESYSDIASAVLASSAFPAMLTPVNLEGELWTDGGVRDITPLGAAIQLGAESVDIIICSPKEVSQSFPKSPKVLQMIERSLDIMSNEVNENDLTKADLINRLVEANVEPKKKYVTIRVIRPNSELINDSLNFGRNEQTEMRRRGNHDAKVICMLSST